METELRNLLEDCRPYVYAPTMLISRPRKALLARLDKALSQAEEPGGEWTSERPTEVWEVLENLHVSADYVLSQYCAHTYHQRPEEEYCEPQCAGELRWRLEAARAVLTAKAAEARKGATAPQET